MDSVIEQIKSKVDIVALVSSYISLKKSGKNYKAVCPFHGEKTPSFMVSPELGIFKCFGCQRGGDIFAFIKEYEKVEFNEALNILAKIAGIKLKSQYQSSEGESKAERLYKLNQVACDFFHYILTSHKFGQKARDYLAKRNIKETTINSFKIGYAPNSWDSLFNFLLSKNYPISDIVGAGLAVQRPSKTGYYDMFRGRVVFPLCDSLGRILGFSARTLFNEEPKYINTQETEIFKKDRFLFGLNLSKNPIKKENVAIIVEGEFDMISPYQEGITNVVASKGVGLTLGQMNLLKRLCETIIVFFDSDMAGLSASERVIEIAQELELNVKVATLENYKDPDEAISKNKKEFFSALKNCLNIYDYFFYLAEKNFKIEDPLDKKKAGKYLINRIAKIKNSIEKDYYVKKLAIFLGVLEKSVYEEIGKVELKSKLGMNYSSKDENSFKKDTIQSKPSEYLLALLLKAPLTIVQKYCLKMSPKDFAKDIESELFLEFKTYTAGRTNRFNIKYFYSKSNPNIKNFLEKLYLYDFSEELLKNEDLLEKEILNTYKIFKSQSIKDELNLVSDKIKKAELEGDKELVKKLSLNFSLLSKKLSSF